MGKRSERFELFRLSLMLRTELSLFATDESREDFLRRIFSDDQIFPHRGTTYHYVPLGGAIAGGSGSTDPRTVIVGSIGRQVETEENLSPSEGFTEHRRETWKAATLVIDPSDHEDGQKISVEFDAKVGKPIGIIRSFCEHINENFESLYTIESQPIFDLESFWSWVSEHNSEIVEFSIQLVAPNGLFNTRNTIREEMKLARELTNASQVGITLKGQEPLNIAADPIQEAVDYVESSGGVLRSKAADGSRYSSLQRPKTVEILTSDSDAPEPLLVRISSEIDKILGR